MIINKPEDISYTDMCIYINEHAYEDFGDDAKLYEYLWLLVDMLARKGAYFKDKLEHEDFCFFATNYVYNRLKSKKQEELKSDGTPRMCKIKNILDYLKKSLQGLKIIYKKNHKPSNQISYEELVESGNEIIYQQLFYKISDDMRKIEFELCLNDVTKLIKKFVYRTPYGGTKDFSKIYKSCLLSLMNMMTLTNASVKSIEELDETRATYDRIVNDFYNQEKEDFVILYHLPSYMKDYIRILTLRISSTIVSELEI